MAFASSVVWEVRSATGSDNNGGAFDPTSGVPGTDFSQQAAAQVAFTDLVIDGTTNTKCTSAAHPFSSASVGNIINITAGTGFTVQRVQIMSVSGVTATCDKSLGTLSSTGGTGNLGGALATLSQAVTLGVQNNTIYCSGSQTITTTITLSLTSSTGAKAPYRITGYSTVRGDGGQFTLQTSTNSVHLITVASSARDYVLQNLLIKSTAGTPGHGIQCGTSGASQNVTLDNCRITGTNIGINCPFSTQYYILPVTLNNCEIDHCTSHGINTVAAVFILNSYIHDNAGDGLHAGNAGQTYQTYAAVGSVFRANVNGISINTFPGVVINCALLDHSNAGFLISGSNFESVTIINTIVDSNVKGFSSSGGACGVFKNNATRGNTTLNDNFPVFQEGQIFLTADPFTNRSGGDFTLNSTAGGGAALKAAGFQSTVL